MKQLLKWLLPHGLVRIWQIRQERGYQRARVALAPTQVYDTASHENLVRFLMERGIDETQIREGSIPPESLDFLASFVRESAADGTPLLGLHVGNFLGVSLAFITAAARACHSDSVVVAVDPNLEHRGISHPQDHVCSVLAHCGLSANVLLCCGFSEEKNVGNDGRNYLENYRLLTQEEIAASVLQQHAPTDVLSQLARLQAKPFDFALIDGNHESSYVQSELRRLHPLMKRGGLVFMDDVSEGWPMLKKVFESSESEFYRCRESNGRVGVLQAI